MKDDRLYLINIKKAIERIEEYTEDGEDAFPQDNELRSQVTTIRRPLSYPIYP